MPQLKVLFLDDDPQRHVKFADYSRFRKWNVTHVTSADEAITELTDYPYELVFLDHDLALEDNLCAVGEPTSAPTGMKVVDHICQMSYPPSHVVVHSMNTVAAKEMELRLRDAKVKVDRVPFHHLVLE